MSVALVVIVTLGLALAACTGSQVLPGKSNFAPGKPGKITVAVKGLKDMGRDGDTELAHVNPEEKRMLKKMGGSGTINPKTGLKEFRFGGGGHGASNDSRENDRGSDRDDGRSGAKAPSKADWGRAVDSLGPSKAPDRSWAGGLDDDSGSVTIERRKSILDVAPGDEGGGQDQRDGSLILNITTQPEGGELGGGAAEVAGKKDDEKRAGRAASILSGTEGIRDKLGRSGRRGVGKSLG